MPKARKITRRTPHSPPASPVLAIAADRLLGDIRALIEAAREQTARAVNSALVGLYWHIGTRIRQDILREKRAGYGEEIVATLSRQLTAEYGRGYSKPNRSRMIRLAGAFQDRGVMFHAVRSNVTPQSKMRSTGMRQPGTAGSASATWPRRKPTGCSGASARYTFTHAAIGSTSQTTSVPASK